MKLKLKVDELRVDTFTATRTAARQRGTVRANESTEHHDCFSNQWSCFLDTGCGHPTGLSCETSCVDTYECCM